MNFNLQRMLESKRAFRERLASRPIGEKLRILDAMRAREVAIRRSAMRSGTNTVRENPPPYPSEAK